MKNSSSLLDKALLSSSILSLLAALSTLFPYDQAPWPNILGYKSLCPFAPAASFALLLLSGLAFVIRRSLRGKKGFRSQRSLLFLSFLVFAFGLSSYVWSLEKVKYLDILSGESQKKPDTSLSVRL